MMTFYENPHYYTPQLKVEEKPLDYNDFIISYQKPVAELCDNADWKYIVSQLRHQIFNSTSVSFSAPETYFLKQAKSQKAKTDMLSMIDSDENFRFNSDAFRTADPLSYRRHRSENLLLRMIHCSNLDLNQISLMRLSKGVFVHQKWQSSTPQPSPTLSAIEETLCIDRIAEAPIDTFHFDNVCHMTHNLTHSCYEIFIPYSYTFGARYTNPYGNANDIVIRGKLPLWCQTLFLSTCLKQTTDPIRPHVPRVGLFPFAPQVAVTFKTLTLEDANIIMPELTILYERFTMEHIDPFAFPEQCGEEYEHQWPERKREVLENILVCDLPDELAKLLSDMATVWAASQGLML